MEDENAQMAAMQAQFEETIAKLREDLTARLRVQEAANKSMWHSWYGGQRRDDGMIPRGGGMLRQLQQHWSRDGGMPRQQQLQQHWSRDGGISRQQQQQQHWSRGGGMPRQQQQQHQWSRGGGIPHQHQCSSHVFPPARQARQQQPLQQPPPGIPTIGGDGEDGRSPLSETFFGGDGGAVEEWLQSGNMEMPVFSLSEGPQQSAPTAVALAATAPAAEAVTGISVFPAVSSKGVAETPTSSMGVASAAVPAAAPSTGGTVFPTASVGGAARAPSSADETAVLTAEPATSDTVPSAAPIRGAIGARESSTGAASSNAAAEAAPSTGDTAAPGASVERAARQLTLEGSSAGTASSDAAAEAAPLTGDTAAPDASVKRVARKLTLEAGSSSEICGERGASTHPFDPGTVFPLEVRCYKGSWLQHGSSSSSKSNSSSSSNSNDSTSNHDSWWDATCVGALLRPFDPGKRYRRSARIGRAVLVLDLPFDRGKAWRRMQHGG